MPRLIDSFEVSLTVAGQAGLGGAAANWGATPTAVSIGCIDGIA